MQNKNEIDGLLLVFMAVRALITIFNCHTLIQCTSDIVKRDKSHERAVADFFNFIF